MSREAMKLALEALEYIEHNYMSLPAPAEKAITALREALAEQPAQQEPVAWRWLYNGQPDSEKHFSMPGPDAEVISRASACEFPRTVQYLYTSPPQQEPVKSGEGASATVTITLPAQQEPEYAWPTVADYERDVGFQTNEAFRIAWNMARTTNRMLGHASSQPAQRTWVGLTDEDKHYLNEVLNLQGRFPVIDAIEARLKEKNT